MNKLCGDYSDLEREISVLQATIVTLRAQAESERVKHSAFYFRAFEMMRNIRQSQKIVLKKRRNTI